MNLIQIDKETIKEIQEANEKLRIAFTDVAREIKASAMLLSDKCFLKHINQSLLDERTQTNE